MPPKKYISTERIDETLRFIYAEGGSRKVDRAGVPTLRQFGRKIGWPVHALMRRAQKLGLPKINDSRRWTKAEDAVLERNSKASLKKIQRLLKNARYDRTVSAIRARFKLTRFRQNSGYTSANQLAQFLGYATHYAVCGWIERGLLQAKRRSEDDKGARTKEYLISDEDIRRFILENPTLINLKRVDQVWFFDVMFEGKAGISVSDALREPTPVVGDEDEADWYGVDDAAVISELLT